MPPGTFGADDEQAQRVERLDPAGGIDPADDAREQHQPTTSSTPFASAVSRASGVTTAPGASRSTPASTASSTSRSVATRSGRPPTGAGGRGRHAAGGVELPQHPQHDPHDQLDVGIGRHRIRATRRTWAKCRGDVMPSPVTVPIAKPGYPSPSAPSPRSEQPFTTVTTVDTSRAKRSTFGG